MARLTAASADEAFARLLDAHERRPDRQSTVYVYPDARAIPSDAASQAFRARVMAAAAAGAVQVAWQRPGQRYVERISLPQGEDGRAVADPLYVFLGRPPPAPAPLAPTARRLLDLAAPSDAATRAAWIELAAAVADWPDDALAPLVAELARLRREPPDRPAFLAAAAGPLAASKLLDRLPKAALRRLGIPLESYPAAPLVLLTAGAATPEATILVENPRAFERAARATAEMPVAWISSHGLAATTIAEAFSGRCLGAPVAGAPPPLATLLSGPALYYWGDLDRAGLEIFARARACRPGLALSGLYRPMIELLRSGGGHPYTRATGKEGQNRWHSDDPALADLLSLCDRRAVDQEWLDETAIRAGCRLPLFRSKG